MKISEIVEELIAAGTPVSGILIAIKAIEQLEDKITQQRAASNERKRRQRKREAEMSRDMSRDSHVTVTPENVTCHTDISEKQDKSMTYTCSEGSLNRLETADSCGGGDNSAKERFPHTPLKENILPLKENNLKVTKEIPPLEKNDEKTQLAPGKHSKIDSGKGARTLEEYLKCPLETAPTPAKFWDVAANSGHPGPKIEHGWRRFCDWIISHDSGKRSPTRKTERGWVATWRNGVSAGWVFRGYMQDQDGRGGSSKGSVLRAAELAMAMPERVDNSDNTF